MPPIADLVVRYCIAITIELPVIAHAQSVQTNAYLTIHAEQYG